ncbi:MAG: glycosyltransferase family 39 protein [Opitutaceae bacterium]|nr:glycosyltransferase family 39 protein [Opitutaceae bacterium]
MAEPTSSPSPETGRDRSQERWLWVVFLAMVGLAAWMLTRSWQASILDRYEFRQLQTALSAYWVTQEGFRLDYLTPLFGPPWSIPMEFPTYQWCVAAVAMVCGLPVEQAGRLVGVGFYGATLPAAYGLLALAGLNTSRRLLTLAVILVTPVYLFYPRTVMIETAALCFAVWFLFALHRSLATRRITWLAASVALGVLAALTKITTLVVFLPPAFALGLDAARTVLRTSVARRARELGPVALRVVLPVALAVGVAYAWISHGDAIKHSNPYTGFLASTELRQWNYGPLGLRLEPSFWQNLRNNVFLNVLSEGGLALALVCAAFATRRARWVALAAAAGFISGPLVFANLYHVHDYYFTANALLLTGAAGMLLASAWDNPRFPGAARWVALLVFLGLQYQAFDRNYHYYYWKEAPPPPALADIIRESVPAEGVVLISGADWNPLLPYYAERRAVMVAGGRDAETEVLEDVAARLPPRKVVAMVLVGNKLRPDRALIRARAERFGLSPHAFATSDDADLYLAAELVDPAAERLAHRTFATARVLVSPPSPEVGIEAGEEDLTQLAFPSCSPSPHRARSQFGVSLQQVEGRAVISAHARSELFFRPPPGARRIAAVVGLPAATHAKPLPEATDGVVIEIFEQRSDGSRRSLLRRELNPAARLEDRGPQALAYEQEDAFSGELVFFIGPGAAGNNAYDQAYWAGIEIR